MRVVRHDPAHLVGPSDEIENSSPCGLVRRTREEFGGYDGGEMSAWQLLLQQPEGRTEEAIVDDGDVRAGVEDQSLTGESRVSCRTPGRVPVSA